MRDRALVDRMLPYLLDCVLAGTRSPKKCLGLLLAQGVDVPEGVGEAEVQAILGSPEFAAAERAARIYDGADEVHISLVARRILRRYGFQPS